jgi:NAD(P)-dependent dehydrogenase (short-subunit alcohol dehydrogenase family)
VAARVVPQQPEHVVHGHGQLFRQHPLGIIGLTSGGDLGFPDEACYGAAKAAQVNYTMSAALELELARLGSAWRTSSPISLLTPPPDHGQRDHSSVTSRGAVTAA